MTIINHIIALVVVVVVVVDDDVVVVLTCKIDSTVLEPITFVPSATNRPYDYYCCCYC